MNPHIVRKRITIKSEPSAVWDALTNGEKTKQYFFNCRVISQWKEGSPITFKGRMLFIIPIEMKGKILKIEPGQLLQYTLSNKGGTTSTVTDTLHYENGKTVLSITDDVGAGEGAGSRYKRSQKGWDKILKGLKKLVEESAPQ
jgi:uncharacterized protein YndB with AHSA1/START domain